MTVPIRLLVVYASLIAGCTTSMVVARPRDGGEPEEPALAPEVPSFGDANLVDVLDEPIDLGDPVDSGAG